MQLGVSKQKGRGRQRESQSQSPLVKKESHKGYGCKLLLAYLTWACCHGQPTTAFVPVGPPSQPCLPACKLAVRGRCLSNAMTSSLKGGVLLGRGFWGGRPIRSIALFMEHSTGREEKGGHDTEAKSLNRSGQEEDSVGEISAGAETRGLRRQKPRRGDKNAHLKGKGQMAANSGSMYSIAIQHDRRRNYSAARRMFELLLNSYENDAAADAPDGRVFLAWGKMEARLNNHWAMRKAFAKGLKLIPDNTHIPHAWAIEELKVGNVDSARKLFGYALESDPSDGLVYQSFALLEQQAGNIDGARALLEEGTRKDPTNVFLWSACGIFESRQGRLHEAANMFQQASMLGPNHCQTWQAYGVLLEKMGRQDEAAEKFQRALEIDPSSVPTVQAYGLMEARRGRYDKARALFERGVAIDGSHAPIFHAWARMEEEAGDYEKARQLFNSGVASAPDSVALLKAWAMMELRLGHIDASNQWYVSPKMGSRKLSKVSERLEMLRLLMEQRSEDDLKLVMQWIEQQHNQQLQTEVSQMLSVGAPVPDEWEDGHHYTFGAGRKFMTGDLVIVHTPGALASRDNSAKHGHAASGRLSFGRVIARPAIEDKAKDNHDGDSDRRCGSSVFVHFGTLKIDGPRLPSPRQPTSEGRQQRKASGTNLSKLKVIRRGEVGTRLSESMVTALFSEEEVGKVILTRLQMIEMHRTKKGQEDGANGFNLHAQRQGDRLRLQILMERYGEEYNMINLPAWVREPDLHDNDAEPDSQAHGGGVALLEQWVQRRSDDDVTAFRKWFNDMYERDPSVAMKMLDWKMPSIWDLPDENGLAPPRVPTEWTRLKQPSRSLPHHGSDDDDAMLGEGKLIGAESLFRRLLQERTGVNSELIQVAEFCLTLAILSVSLVYGPSFTSQWVQRSPQVEQASELSQPSLPLGLGGVDAYLLQTGMHVLYGRACGCGCVVVVYSICVNADVCVCGSGC